MCIYQSHSGWPSLAYKSSVAPNHSESKPESFQWSASPHHSSDLLSTSFPLTHLAIAMPTLSSLNHIKHVPASLPLPVPFPLLGTFSSRFWEMTDWFKTQFWIIREFKITLEFTWNCPLCCAVCVHFRNLALPRALTAICLLCKAVVLCNGCLWCSWPVALIAVSSPLQSWFCCFCCLFGGDGWSKSPYCPQKMTLGTTFITMMKKEVEKRTRWVLKTVIKHLMAISLFGRSSD